MKKVTAVLFCICIIFFGKNYVLDSTEDRINSAFPISQELEFSKSDILSQLDSNKAKIFEDVFNNKLKLRALKCSDGYEPSWYSTKQKIRSSIKNSSCFNDTDNEINKWIGFHKVGLLLLQPPLVKKSIKSKKYILADGYIEYAGFAKDADIAILVANYETQILDISTNKVIYRTKEIARTSGADLLSPNGRLFYTSSQDGVKIRNSEDGSILLSLSDGTNSYFSWINSRFGFYRGVSEGKYKSVVIDFLSGKESAVNFVSDDQIYKIYQIEGTDNQFILCGFRNAYKFEINSENGEIFVNLLAEKKLDRGTFANNSSSITFDGNMLFCASTDLSLISTEDFVLKTIKFEPFRVQEGFKTPDPDKIIIRGYVNEAGQANYQQKYYLFSISDNTISPIEDINPSNGRLIYIEPFESLGVIKDSKVELLDSLQLGNPIHLNKFIGDLATEISLLKLQQIEKQESFRRGINYPASMQGAQSHLSSQSYIQSNSRSLQDPVLTAPAPFAELAKNAQIEAVGVYESESSHKNGTISIKIQKSLKPIILVLSSYEGIKWHLSMMPGARVSSIFLSGYEQSEVLGSGTTRITNLGRIYAYQNNSYQNLDAEVFKMTGKRIDFFQGRYKASQFTVGGL